MTSRARPSVTGGIALALALAALGAGCGGGGSGDGSGGGTAADPAAFVGTWLYGQTQSVIQCPGADPMNALPEPNKTFARGVSSALVDLSPSPLLQGVFCDFAFDIDSPGTTAIAHPDQTCALTSLDSLSIDKSMGAPLWTFTLTSASTAEELVQATAHFQISGQIESCSWILQAHLTRVSKD